MSIWREERDGVEIEGLFDPLCIERSKPFDDAEAALVEALCQAGAVVVSLPDGRLIVSLTAGVEHTKCVEALEANAQLICKARYLLLRLLRDRQQWKEEREFLLERIRTLEAALGDGEAGPPRVPR